jgi:hypothetical protein
VAVDASLCEARGNFINIRAPRRREICDDQIDFDYNAALDSAELLAYECASRNQWKQRKFILLFSAF